MGTPPCKQKAARSAIIVLLALQTSLITVASYGTASADTSPPSTAVVAVSPSTVNHPADARGAVAQTPTADAQRSSKSPHQQVATVRKTTETKPDQPIRLGQAQAFHRLKAAGLRWKSSGGCTDRRLGHCTSLQAVRAATVADVIDLKRDSKCPVVVTGGTEVGHSPGRYSHHRGYKLDIRPNRCISDYITDGQRPDAVRGDGAPLYRDGGTVYAREPDHWDILFR
ncbi:hypothetical protein FHR32_002909 [Streptosporangium album]|uniref:Peptidase M15B domain-containing protein n=1 Tax=Streptosporangium album TaxID=47479 RepID=A0A7W7RUP7_9ACTN|nr:hypothetical protein [Streptosporangium album]MBB4938604.1 hypothetical protein [Streptosporangium album]